MRRALGICLALSGLGLSQIGSSYNFSREDELFKKREGGFAMATEARKAYAHALGQGLSEDEKVYAISQIARLDLYRGGMLENEELKNRKDALDECIDSVKEIKDTGRQEYYYFKLACSASRGKISSDVKKVLLAKEMQRLENKALEATTQDNRLVGGFEGGGILRILAAVNGNIIAKRVGLFHPEKALEYADLALDTRTIANRPFPGLSGREYFENHYYKAMAQITYGLDRDEQQAVRDGILTMQSAVEEIAILEEAGLLPEGREPETRFYKNLMAKVKSHVADSLNHHDWKDRVMSFLGSLK